MAPKPVRFCDPKCAIEMRRVHQRVCRPILRSANKRNWQTTCKTVLANQLAQWAGNGITEKGKPRVDGVNLAKGSTALLRHAKPLPQVVQSCHFPPFLSLLGVLSPGSKERKGNFSFPCRLEYDGCQGEGGLVLHRRKICLPNLQPAAGPDTWG